MSDVVQKSKLVMKDLANPKNVVSDDFKEAEFFMGTVIGIASGLKTGADPQGKPYTGLKGTFEGVPSDPERDTVRSGVCYLPSGFQEPVEAALAGGDATVRFAFEIYSVKSTAPIGYSYLLKPISTPETIDPLAEFRHSVKQITDASREPAAETGGRKGRRAA